MPPWAPRQAPTLLWLWECGLVNVSWWSKQSQRDCTLLLSYVFRVWTIILGSLSLECENTYTSARRVALFCEHFVAPTASAGRKSWMFISMRSFFQQILINMLFISFESSSNFSCLLPAMPLSILFTPSADLVRSQEIALLGTLELLRRRLLLELLLRGLLCLRNCRIDPCGENCYDAVRVLCVDFLLQELSHLHWLSSLRCHV